MPNEIRPQHIQPSARWSIAVGAIFGAITLSGLFVFAFIAGTSNPYFICRSFQLLAGVFALGAALSAAFLGGGASATSDSKAPLPIVFSLGGGVAVLIIAFIAFSYFEPKECPAARDFQSGQADFQLQQRTAAVAQIKQATELVGPIDKALEAAINHAVGASGNTSDNATCVYRHTQQAQIIGSVKSEFDNLALLLATSLPALTAETMTKQAGGS